LTARARGGAQLALYLATVAIYADMYITQPILPLLSHEFGVAPATAGLTVSAVVLAIAIASSAYGPISDMLGRKPVMVLSCAILALPTLLCAFAPSFGALLLFRTLQGLLIPGVTAVLHCHDVQFYSAAFSRGDHRQPKCAAASFENVHQAARARVALPNAPESAVLPACTPQHDRGDHPLRRCAI